MYHHIQQVYTVQELKDKIASHEFNAELLLQHAMVLLEKYQVNQCESKVVVHDLDEVAVKSEGAFFVDREHHTHQSLSQIAKHISNVSSAVDPVGEVSGGIQGNGAQSFKLYGDDSLPIGTKIYATPQQVAEQDELQHAAKWIYQGLHPCEVTDIQKRLMVGYNRAKRLYDTAEAAKKGGCDEQS